MNLEKRIPMRFLIVGMGAYLVLMELCMFVIPFLWSSYFISRIWIALEYLPIGFFMAYFVDSRNIESLKKNVFYLSMTAILLILAFVQPILCEKLLFYCLKQFGSAIGFGTPDFSAFLSLFAGLYYFKWIIGHEDSCKKTWEIGVLFSFFILDWLLMNLGGSLAYGTLGGYLARFTSLCTTLLAGAVIYLLTSTIRFSDTPKKDIKNGFLCTFCCLLWLIVIETVPLLSGVNVSDLGVIFNTLTTAIFEIVGMFGGVYLARGFLNKKKGMLINP